MSIAGVIGFPISHSKSPLMHRYWIKKYDIKGDYIPLNVDSQNLKEVISVLPKMGFKGVNITIPHKIQALSCVDIVEDQAKKAGAINLIIFSNGKSIGKNTDGFGFIENLKEKCSEIDFKTKTAVILGTGGAARGVLNALFNEGIQNIKLVYRTEKKALDLSSLFDEKIELYPWDRRSDVLENTDVLINTTPLGMIHQDSLDISLKMLKKSAVVCDLVYNPLYTPLLKQALARNLIIADGLGMLIHQARPAFYDWFGVMPEITQDLRQLMEQSL